MTLGPDDLPPPGGLQQLFCECTSETFKAIISADGIDLLCSACGKSIMAVTPSALANLTGDRDMIPLPKPPARPQNKALLRGGDLDGKTIPILPDVTTFMVGSGFGAMTTGAAWADTAAEALKKPGDLVYQDSGELTPEGVRIFDVVGSSSSRQP